MKYWLRAESKDFEFRRALSPATVKKLLAAGHEVVVEDSDQSISPISDYINVGAKAVPAHSWITQADKDWTIIGLKALPKDVSQYIHTHIYFAHVYKQQEGYQEVLGKFQSGRIIDLEYMTRENSSRVAAFGYWAGYVGAALGHLFALCTDKAKATADLKEKQFFKRKEDLLTFLSSHTENPRGKEAIVVGCQGRSGTGATELLNTCGYSVIGWDKNDTGIGGPFPSLLNFDVLVNCVLSTVKVPPLLTHHTLERNQRLKVISDVSCDPDSEFNLLPIYQKATTIEDPLINIKSSPSACYLTAIDNLPSLLPYESMLDFSEQLEPYLLDFQENSGPIANALKIYEQNRIIL
jgi:saccharopine dehydrogenase (NAD+, L-lysine-forming)